MYKDPKHVKEKIIDFAMEKLKYVNSDTDIKNILSEVYESAYNMGDFHIKETVKNVSFCIEKGAYSARKKKSDT